MGEPEPAGVLLMQPTHDLSPIPAKTHTGERGAEAGEVDLFVTCRAGGRGVGGSVSH